MRRLVANRRFGLWFLVVAIALPGLKGCTPGSSLPNSVPVQGTVLLDGEPLSHGTVGFAPSEANGGHPAVGQIKDGKFTMITSESSPGVAAGDYKVTITCIDPSTVVELEPDQAPDPNNPPPPPDSLIPVRYNQIDTSGLEVTVTPGMGPVEFLLESGE